MRILLGIACLVALFLLSSTWHRSRMNLLRETPGGLKTARAGDRVGELPEGWGELRIGAASGAQPVFLEPPPQETRYPEPAEAPAPLDPREADPAAQDWELRVKSGDVLSRIVRLHYGRVSPDLERRLAEYNGLVDPDRLEVGQLLYLPPEDRLVEATP